MRSTILAVLMAALSLGNFSIVAAQVVATGQPTTIVTTPYGAPGGVTVAPVAQGAQVSWGAVQGATLYQVLRGADSVSVTPWGGAGSTTSVTDGSVAPGSVVFYRVAALYANGTSAVSGATAYQAAPALRTAMTVSGGGLSTIQRPNREPPTGVAVSPLGVMVARLTWPAVTGAVNYAITRTDATGAPSSRSPASYTLTYITDTVPDARQAYAYRVSVYFPDNGYGQSEPVSFTSPPPANPAWMRATTVAGEPTSVELTWETRAGATGYWVRGPGLAGESAVVPGGAVLARRLGPGQYSWRVIAVYPSNAMDTTTARVASAIVRVLPSKTGLFLSKPAGNGDYATSTAHAEALCDKNTVGCGRERADSAFGRLGLHSRHAFIEYHNRTDFGQHRRSWCQQRVDQILCWAENDVTLTAIVIRPAGAQFLAFEEAEPGIWRQTTGTRIDGEGRKVVPNSCISCHGGTYDPATRLVQGATLLPIDPSLVQLTTRGCYRGIGASDGDIACVPSEGARQMNAMVYAASTNPAVRRYVYGLYGGSQDVANAPAVQNYVPQSWRQQNPSFYLDVLRPNCVMCHLAARPSLDFTTQSNFFGNAAAVHNSVCVQRTMPHAEVPFKRFWTEDTGNIFVPGLVATLLGFKSC